MAAESSVKFGEGIASADTGRVHHSNCVHPRTLVLALITNTKFYMHMSMRVYLFVCTYIYICVCMYICIVYMYIYAHVRRSMHIPIYSHVTCELGCVCRF